MNHLIVVALLCILVLSSCTEYGSSPPPSGPSPEEPIDPDVPTTSLQNFIRTGSDASLSERAITASGVYDDLGVDRYPLLLMFVEERGALEAYITEQGLSEGAFLAHPRLPQFVKSHVVYDEVDVLKLRSTPGANATFESAAGTEVVIRKDVDSGVTLANGVPIDLQCLEGRDPAYNTEATGLLCYVAKPIVEDFDWSQ